MFSPAVLAALLALLHAASATGFHTLPSGRRIPLEAIRSHPHADKEGDYARQLYELSAAGALAHASGNVLNLDAHTRSAELSYHPQLSVSLNDRVLDRDFPAATVRSGPGFSAVYAHGDDQPVAITLNEYELVPLHFAKHPGIYIATGRRSLVHTIQPEAADVANSRDISLTPRLERDQASTVDEEAAEIEGEAAFADMRSVAWTTGRPKTAAHVARVADSEHSEHTMSIAVRQKRACGAGARKRFYELALAFDNALCARYDHRYERVVAALQASASGANAAFWGDVCVRLAVVHVEAHCRSESDPYARANGQLMQSVLRNFQQVWTTRRAWVRRDLAMLVTGAGAPDAWTSVTYPNSSCSRKNGYAVAQRVDRRAFAKAVAFTIGGKLASSGLLDPSSAHIVIWLSKQSAALIRKYLETDGRSWCITSTRRFCSKQCKKCVAGTCVIPTVGTARKPKPPMSGSARRCSAGFAPARPLACELSLGRTRLITPWLDVLYVSSSVQYGRVVTRVDVQVGSVKLEIGYGVGSAASNLSGPPGRTRHAQTQVFRTVVGGLAVPGGATSCCGRTLFYTLRVGGCLEGTCGVMRKTYSFVLRCATVCARGGTPVAMTATRQCPTCLA